MKRLGITIFLAVLAHLTFAQAQKGDWSVTGMGSYYESNTEGKTFIGSKYKVFEVNPSIGYFVTNNLELGIKGGYQSSKQHAHIQVNTDFFYVNDVESNNSSVGVYAKAYKFLANKIAFFGQGEVTYSHSISDYNTRRIGLATYEAISEIKSDYVSVALRPGFAFFLTDKLSLNSFYGSVTYNQREDKSNRSETIFGGSTTSKTKNNHNDIIIDLSGNSFGLGLSFYF